MTRSIARSFPWGASLAACALLASETAGAQEPDGFLFQVPYVTVTARVGYTMPHLGSDLFDFTREQLTLGRSDFNAPYVGGELGIRITERLDLVAGGGWTGGRSSSEFRDWVGEDDLPIEQQTSFQRSYLTAGAKLYLTDKGRRVGSFAWVPSGVAPYVGVSAGRAWYVFEQEGDFVDFETLDIFPERFRTTGSGWTGQVAVGLDVSLTSRFLLNGEARYGWAKAPLDTDFVGFGDIDLSGAQATVGLGIRL